MSIWNSLESAEKSPNWVIVSIRLVYGHACCSFSAAVRRQPQDYTNPRRSLLGKGRAEGKKMQPSNSPRGAGRGSQWPSCCWAVRGCLTEPLVWVFCTTSVLPCCCAIRGPWKTPATLSMQRCIQCRNPTYMRNCFDWYVMQEGPVHYGWYHSLGKILSCIRKLAHYDRVRTCTRERESQEAVPPVSALTPFNGGWWHRSTRRNKPLPPRNCFLLHFSLL